MRILNREELGIPKGKYAGLQCCKSAVVYAPMVEGLEILFLRNMFTIAIRYFSIE